VPFDPVRPTVAVDRIKQSYANLSLVAAILNKSSDRLSTNITNLEIELKKLGVGVSSFYEFSGDYSYPEPQKVETYPFNEEPRGIRVKAVNHIPDLLDVLAKDAKGMADEVDGQAAAVAEMTQAIASSGKVSAGSLMKALSSYVPTPEDAAARNAVLMNPGQISPPTQKVVKK
jgi:hypothetical protein